MTQRLACRESSTKGLRRMTARSTVPQLKWSRVLLQGEPQRVVPRPPSCQVLRSWSCSAGVVHHQRSASRHSSPSC